MVATREREPAKDRNADAASNRIVIASTIPLIHASKPFHRFLMIALAEKGSKPLSPPSMIVTPIVAPTMPALVAASGQNAARDA
jgi:hypothetical protein